MNAKFIADTWPTIISQSFCACVCAGLTLVANVQQHQYVTEVGTTAGLIVLVHPQNMMPFPEDRGKLVSPGYQTEMAITQVWRETGIFYISVMCASCLSCFSDTHKIRASGMHYLPEEATQATSCSAGSEIQQ